MVSPCGMLSRVPPRAASGGLHWAASPGATPCAESLACVSSKPFSWPDVHAHCPQSEVSHAPAAVVAASAWAGRALPCHKPWRYRRCANHALQWAFPISGTTDLASLTSQTAACERRTTAARQPHLASKVLCTIAGRGDSGGEPRPRPQIRAPLRSLSTGRTLRSLPGACPCG